MFGSRAVEYYVNLRASSSSALSSASSSMALINSTSSSSTLIGAVLEDVAFTLEKNSNEPSSQVKLKADWASLAPTRVPTDCSRVVDPVKSAIMEVQLLKAADVGVVRPEEDEPSDSTMIEVLNESLGSAAAERLAVYADSYLTPVLTCTSIMADSTGSTTPLQSVETLIGAKDARSAFSLTGELGSLEFFSKVNATSSSTAPISVDEDDVLLIEAMLELALLSADDDDVLSSSTVGDASTSASASTAFERERVAIGNGRQLERAGVDIVRHHRIYSNVKTCAF